MNRAERFALFAGIVGLVTDAITLLLLAASATALDDLPPITIEATMLSMLYGWFLVSWVLVRRRLSLTGIKNIRTEFFPAWFVCGGGIRAVSGIGILLAPLQLLVFAIVFPPSEWKKGVGDWTNNFLPATFGIVVLSGFCILMALILLMPMIYRDIE